MPPIPPALHDFSIHYEFPLYFTSGVWCVDNPLFADTVRRLEPGARHRVLIVIDADLSRARPHLCTEIADYFAHFSDALTLAGPPVVVAGGEIVKNDFAHVLQLLEQISAVGLDRHSYVAVVGGGAVLDMASFAAAIAHRGIRVIRVPTTVLSQADSGVGVKNGVNLFGKKNFAGTFVPPFAVINDVALLETLSERDRIAGVVEAVKVALLRDPELFAFIETNADRITDTGVLQHLIRRSAELHLRHICTNGDPFELGSARPLDFGHWAAHKLESLTRYRLRHGEAVAIGLALDLTYSVAKGYLQRAVADRIIGVLRRIGYRLWDEALATVDAGGRPLVLAGLDEFREHLGGELHVTLLRDIGDSFEVTEMDHALVTAALDRLRTCEPAMIERQTR